MLCHYSNKSCDHKHCDAGDIMLLLEHMLKELCEFMGGSPSRPCLVAIGLVHVEIQSI